MSAPERPPEGEPVPARTPVEPRWGLGDAAAGFLIGLMLSSLLAAVWLASTGQEELSLGGQALSELGLWAGLVGCVVFASKRKGRGRLELDFGFAGRWVDVAIGAVAGAFGQVALVPAVGFLLRPILGDPDVSGPAEELFDKASGASSAVLFLFVVLGAPIVEELFFRGLLLRSLEKRVGAALAIVLSAAIFGLAHPQPLGPKALALVMISLAALGALLAALAVHTRRLGAPIVAHAVFNGWTAVVLLTR